MCIRDRYLNEGPLLSRRPGATHGNSRVFATNEGCRPNEAPFYWPGGEHIFAEHGPRGSSGPGRNPDGMRGPPLNTFNNCARVFRELWIDGAVGHI
eukprot:11243257-Alexandrium_andersonii.AAC.1